jgi:hypothetical protein
MKARRESLPGGHFTTAQPLLVHENKDKAKTSTSPDSGGIVSADDA